MLNNKTIKRIVLDMCLGFGVGAVIVGPAYLITYLAR